MTRRDLGRLAAAGALGRERCANGNQQRIKDRSTDMEDKVNLTDFDPGRLYSGALQIRAAEADFQSVKPQGSGSVAEETADAVGGLGRRFPE